MKIPAEAFAQRYPKDLKPGALFKFRGRWALRVSHGADFQAFLMLEGERAGWVFQLDGGIAQTVAIVEPFGWFPMVAIDAKPTLEADRTVTLTLTESGPVLVGADARNDWDPAYIAFKINGDETEVQELYRAMRFDQWSVELRHRDRPFDSLGTLLQIDRRRTP